MQALLLGYTVCIMVKYAQQKMKKGLKRDKNQKMHIIFV